MNYKYCVYFIAVLVLGGCATQLTPAGEKVRVVTEAQRSNCEFIKLISYRAGLGPDKPGSALKGALNEAAEVGANGFYIITNTIHWADGASVSGEALKCKNI
ncbi:MAG: hypothetical protein GC139_05915 [Sideroxydans sp.]|nr:hypothetical protein [Sideroxydans sp.]